MKLLFVGLLITLSTNLIATIGEFHPVKYFPEIKINKEELPEDVSLTEYRHLKFGFVYKIKFESKDNREFSLYRPTLNGQCQLEVLKYRSKWFCKTRFKNGEWIRGDELSFTIMHEGKLEKSTYMIKSGDKYKEIEIIFEPVSNTHIYEEGTLEEAIIIIFSLLLFFSFLRILFWLGLFLYRKKSLKIENVILFKIENMSPIKVSRTLFENVRGKFMKLLKIVLVIFLHVFPSITFAMRVESARTILFGEVCKLYNESRYVFSGKFIVASIDKNNKHFCKMKFKIDRVLKAHDFKMEKIIEVVNDGRYFICKNFKSDQEVSIIFKKNKKTNNYSIPILRQGYFDHTTMVKGCFLKDPNSDKKFFK